MCAYILKFELCHGMHVLKFFTITLNSSLQAKTVLHFILALQLLAAVVERIIKQAIPILQFQQINYKI